MRAIDRGTVSEDVAAAYLERQGWSLIARRYRVNRKEIDIIARRDHLVAFIEVKARAGPGCGHPLEAVTWKKRREIRYVAEVWIARNGAPHLSYRFDAIAVIWRGENYTIEHVENAWSL